MAGWSLSRGRTARAATAARTSLPGNRRSLASGRCGKPYAVSVGQPFLDQVSGAIRERLRAGRKLGVEDIAGSLYLSRSALQRRLRERATTFSQLRREVRVEVAIERLTRGESCSSAANHVGLSRDHLCKLVYEYADLTPRQIVRACQLSARVQRWRRSVPPQAGTKLYYKRLEHWRAINAEVEQLLAGLSDGHPLAAWGRELRRVIRRPDYRRQPHRKQVRTERQREKDEVLEELHRAVWLGRQRQARDKPGRRCSSAVAPTVVTDV
jgi:AraC-like DNA-binding protein